MVSRSPRCRGLCLAVCVATGGTGGTVWTGGTGGSQRWLGSPRCGGHSGGCWGHRGHVFKIFSDRMCMADRGHRCHGGTGGWFADFSSTVCVGGRVGLKKNHFFEKEAPIGGTVAPVAPPPRRCPRWCLRWRGHRGLPNRGHRGHLAAVPPASAARLMPIGGTGERGHHRGHRGLHTGATTGASPGPHRGHSPPDRGLRPSMYGGTWPHKAQGTRLVRR